MNYIQDALELALKRELAAFKFYSQLSRHFTANERIQETFSFLTREEERHFCSLANRFQELFKEPILSIESLRERYEKTLTPLIDLKIENMNPNQIGSVKEVLEYAIESEKKSAEFYKNYGANFPEGDAKALLLQLVQEENQHQKTLEAIKMLVGSNLIDMKDLK